MNKKILLIQPPIRDFYCTPMRLEPLGLQYLATAAERVGWESRVLCGAYSRKPRNLETPESMGYLQEHYITDDTSPFSLFKRYQHFGLSWEEIREEVMAFAPRVVGVSALFAPYQEDPLKVAEIVKTAMPEAFVVMGGGFPTCDPEGAAASPHVDCIVKGEGEGPLQELLLGFGEGKRPAFLAGGMSGRQAGNEEASFPQRSLKFLSKSLLTGKLKWVPMQTSRGCPHECAFCSSKLNEPGPFRQREVGDVVSEIMALRNAVPACGINFEDDNLTFQKKWTLDLCGEICKVFGKRKIRLAAMNGLCAADLDNDRLAALWEAGFERLDLSLALHSSELQAASSRKVTTREFLSVVQAAARQGFGVTSYLILGIPGQTLQNGVEAVHVLAGTASRLAPSVFYPTPGTHAFEACLANGWLPAGNPELWRSSCVSVETNEMNRLDLLTFLRSIRLINFLKEHARDSEMEALGRKGATHNYGNPAYDIGMNVRQTGLWLAHQILRSRCFFSLRRLSRDHISIEELPTSSRVFEGIFGEPPVKWIHPLSR